MAKKSPNQLTLFDYKPEVLKKFGDGEKKYKPLDPIAVMFVHYKDGEERSHQSVPDYDVKDHVEFYEERGYTLVVYEMVEYWKKWNNQEFNL